MPPSCARLLFLLLFLCLAACSGGDDDDSPAAPGTAEQIEPAAVSPVILAGDRRDFTVPGNAPATWRLDEEILCEGAPLFTFRPAPAHVGPHVLTARTADDTLFSWDLLVSIHPDDCPRGIGYPAVITSGHHHAANRDELLAALLIAVDGEIIHLADDARIDLAGPEALHIPAGVTLAGSRGTPWDNPGPLLFADRFINAIPLLVIDQPGVRLTGLRLRGPEAEHPGGINGARGAFLHDQVEIDNCDISHWSYAALTIKHTGAPRTHIHHNHFHDCRGPLGYGVQVVSGFPLIEHNTFARCRHAIAGSGRADCGYEAARNTVLSGMTETHCFDMHGDLEHADPLHLLTRFYRAGGEILVHHNTFAWTEGPAVGIRGKPRVGARIHHNRFFHETLSDAVKQSYNPGNLSLEHNLTGTDARSILTP